MVDPNIVKGNTLHVGEKNCLCPTRFKPSIQNKTSLNLRLWLWLGWKDNKVIQFRKSRVIIVRHLMLLYKHSALIDKTLNVRKRYLVCFGLELFHSCIILMTTRSKCVIRFTTIMLKRSKLNWKTGLNKKNHITTHEILYLFLYFVWYTFISYCR